MAGFSVNTNEHLIRSNLWSSQIKEVLLEELMGMKYVDMISDFPDGDTINIPSIGQMEVNDYAEGQPIKYTGMDTGNFTFTINKYKSSATYIYDKFRQDSFYAGRVAAQFVPAQARAIAKAMEVDLLKVGPDGQTASDLNAINGGNHRFIGGGTNEVISLQDFQRARFALQKANVPMTNLVAIVDPSVEYELATLTNLVNVSNNPQWNGIIRDGMSTGMQFKFNIYGWDVYISQNLESGIAETINAKTTTVGVANLFFSATPDVLPFVGAIRQPPRVESFRNVDLQRDQYVTTCRYDFKLFRPENLVVVITDTDQVA
jgi:hypothetical protein